MVDIEQKTVTIPMDANYDARLRELSAEGWQIAPGTTGMAEFQLIRRIGAEPTAAIGIEAKVHVDPDKVGLLRNGYCYWGDGTRSKQGEPWESREPVPT